MSESSLAHVRRICNSAEYQACLDDCIERFSRLQVSSATTNTINNTTANKLATTADISNTSTFKSYLTLSPSSSSSSSFPPSSTSSSGPPSPAPIVMDRQALHGGPPRGPQTWLGSQDARNNLAVPPAANTGNVLKKKAVKMVGPANSVPRATLKAVAAASPVAFSLVPRGENAKLGKTEEPKPAEPVTNIASPTPFKFELPKQSDKSEKSLESMFARLSQHSFSSPTRATPTVSSSLGVRKDAFSFDDKLESAAFPSDASKKDSTRSPATPIKSEGLSVAAPPMRQDTKVNSFENVGEHQAKTNERLEDMSQEDFESEYLFKASEYIEALPPGQDVARVIQIALKKLRAAYTPKTSVNNLVFVVDEAVKLKARYISAIVDHVNKACNKHEIPLATEHVKQVLEETNGNFLLLCSSLVNDKFLSLSRIDEIAGLCSVVASLIPSMTATPASTEEVLNPVKSVDSAKAWPVQEKRENPAAIRTCLLKGVSGIRSINELQALIWGGRLESLSMPENGSSYALVRFLTPEACDNYFKATGNGIEIHGEKRTVVFVEKQPGPTSINDVIQSCIDNDMTRCIRAYEADQGRSDMALMKLARGKGQNKREVERIKRGKTAKGRSYIEFRFANIYHALSFHRQLSTDEDWEPCSIVYAPDPCEIAQGVHSKDEDEDEDGSASFAIETETQG